MKVALYSRVSTKDKGQDTENQLSNSALSKQGSMRHVIDAIVIGRTAANA